MVNNVAGDALRLISREVMRISAVVYLLLSISPIKFFPKKLQFPVSKGAWPMPTDRIERTYKRLAPSK